MLRKFQCLTTLCLKLFSLYMYYTYSCTVKTVVTCTKMLILSYDLDFSDEITIVILSHLNNCGYPLPLFFVRRRTSSIIRLHFNFFLKTTRPIASVFGLNHSKNKRNKKKKIISDILIYIQL